jgi:hypothetical protein
MEDQPKKSEENKAKSITPVVITTIIATLIVVGIVWIASRLDTPPILQNQSTPSATAPTQTASSPVIPSPQQTQPVSYYETGSESLCSQEAQQLADSFNQSTLTISQSDPNLPASSYFIVSSHYVKSQNSCYIELHNQLPLPPNNTTVVDNYTVYVEGGPSEWEVKTGISASYATVATCSTYPNSQTTCNYWDPVEKDQVSGSMSYTNWTDQYDANNAPPMSQQDFQSLVQKDMAAN